MGSEFLGNPSPGAEEGDVDPRERIFRKGLDRVFLATEGKTFSRGAWRCQKAQGGYWKLPTLQHPEHFNANSTGSANNRKMLRLDVLGAGCCGRHGER